MSRESFSRRTANVLRKTIQQLEADPTIDTADPSFINLKCALLDRILQAETGTARYESGIHLVREQAPGADCTGLDEEDSDSSAIA